MKKYCDDSYHPTTNGVLSRFEFFDFEVQRMNFYLKKSCPEIFQALLVPPILEGHADVFYILNFLCFQEVVVINFDCSEGNFHTHSRTDFQENWHLC
jgi:hypothetical protein